MKNSYSLTAILLVIVLIQLYPFLGGGIAVLMLGPLGMYSAFMNPLQSPLLYDNPIGDAGRVITHLLSIVYYIIAASAAYFLLTKRWDSRFPKIVYASGIILAIILFFDEAVGAVYFNYAVSSNWPWLAVRLFSIAVTLWAAHVMSQKKIK